MAYTVIRGKLVKMERSWRTGNKSLAVTIQEHEKRLAAKRAAAEKVRLKGAKGGNCNVTACQKPGATWWNIGSRAYYCRSCAARINHDGCRRYGEPDLCYPSKEEGDAVEAARYEAREAA